MLRTLKNLSQKSTKSYRTIPFSKSHFQKKENQTFFSSFSQNKKNPISCNIKNETQFRNYSIFPETKPQGFINLGQLEKFSRTGEIDTVVVGFTDHIGRFCGKRYDVDFFLKEGVKGSHACEYLITIDIEQKIIDGFEFANWDTGYGDFHAVPDIGTLRVASWLDRTAVVQCNLLSNKTHEMIPQGPRNMLVQQMKRLEKMGMKSFAASELEYFMYKKSYEDIAKDNYVENKMHPFGYFLGDYNLLQATREECLNAEVRRQLKASGIAVETSKGEYGFGQHELNIEYGDVLRMADNHVIYKQCFKEISQKLGYAVTFMAKPHVSQSGSSCHIHMSLWDQNNNVFNGNDELEGEIKCSHIFRHFLAGWLKHTPDIMVFFAPTINSYKRFQSASWAPTKIGWSVDNRTSGFRILGNKGGPGFRIECRIPGADCNPYLAFAGLLAAGIDGIENKLPLPPSLKGDLYNRKDLASLPKNLKDAVEKFENSEFARKNFGETVVKHYSHFYKKEVQEYESAVTDWERKRYFEQI